MQWQGEAPAAPKNLEGLSYRMAHAVPVDCLYPRKTRKSPDSLEGLCPTVHSYSFLEAGEPEQPRSPWGAWTAPPGPGEQKLLRAVCTGCTGHHWKKKKKPRPTTQCPEFKPQVSWHCAGGTWHWWELRHGTCPLPGISGYKQVTSRLQRCPVDSQQEVQTSSSNLRACASQGWGQNKMCRNQAAGPEQLSSQL